MTAWDNVGILEDDEVAYLADLMLDSFGIDSTDFHNNEWVLTGDYFEKNHKTLKKIAETSKFMRKPYF